MTPKVLTFKEKYNEPNLTWQQKAILIALYHTVMHERYSTWTLRDTAIHFEVSIGLVSENIKLAKYIDNLKYGKKLMKLDTREKGLKYIYGNW
jgi:hypothetical protein